MIVERRLQLPAMERLVLLGTHSQLQAEVAFLLFRLGLHYLQCLRFNSYVVTTGELPR